MVGAFVKYNPHTFEVFLKEICSAWRLQLPTGASTSRPDSARYSKELQRITATPRLSTLVQLSDLQSWIVTEVHTDHINEAPCKICLSATEFTLLFFLPLKPVPVVADTLLIVAFEEPEVDELSAKWARMSSTAHSVASVSRSACNTGLLSIIRSFVGRVGVDVEFCRDGRRNTSLAASLIKALALWVPSCPNIPKTCVVRMSLLPILSEWIFRE